MLADRNDMYSYRQALTASGASTDYKNHLKDRNIGMGEPMCVYVKVDVAADGTSGNETYTAALQVDDNPNFSSATQVGETITIPRGTAAGTIFAIPIPPNTAFKQYSRMYYTLGGTTPSVTVTAWLGGLRDAQADAVYPAGYTVGS